MTDLLRTDLPYVPKPYGDRVKESKGRIIHGRSATRCDAM
eukprot:CAMPEP_0184369690 /NCGR_PEP_ID=MMETSP1089-20130417/162385_1 /TAXON_ID=38269 ORGANISM="Gloeochaete wittrockiana, Strain SAG46.84" /NCGR_SAMPLE_ID=MMETSP1089 /ASSEMBLY_ACC=CAM_ASM_000445 /LENGTH=39 /DNA_ID= /DNA_START= /DNA_END= /DNA_ORIENTATION=